MPELPEVEIVRQGLQRYLPGKTVKSVDVRVTKLFHGDLSHVVGAKVTEVNRRAKILLVGLSRGYTLMIHLKMTGQLVFQSGDEKEKIVGGHPQAAYNQPLPHAHTHIIFTFDDGSCLYFNDLRKFGWIKVVKTDDVATLNHLAELGPEPLQLEPKQFRQRTERFPNRTIFQTLLDQTVVSGVGNIYANEALYEAKINPARRVKDISPREMAKLLTALKRVMGESIARGGTSDSTFVSVDGKRGDYLTVAHVYHKKIASPCGHSVNTAKLGGRTTHFCQKCQK